jgi:hypothetical protein
MRRNTLHWIVGSFALFACASLASAADWGLKEGSPELKSAGPLAFGPDGILLVGDTQGATIWAIDTGIHKGDPAKAKPAVAGVAEKIAEKLGVGAAEIAVRDLAVHPLSGDVFVAIAKGGGKPTAGLVRIDGASGAISEVSLKNVPSAKVTLPDPPAADKQGRGGRQDSITDLAYVDGKVLVSGVNDKGGSTVREITFPFAEADQGANIEIYHGAHGKYEDNAAVRTFIPFTVDGEPTVLAGFTCTPLVKFTLADLTAGKKVRGTTVAELGNRNQPLDMIAYEKDGKRFLLMANNNRGVMKISTDNIERKEGITEPVKGGGTEGQKYETIQALKGVVQLDKLDASRAVVLVQPEGKGLNLQVIDLP